jgi:spermidine synthase
VFLSGLTTLGIELTASRLLGSVFGTSNIVWANIIGLMLVYLTAGYFIGGRWADRDPRPVTFYRLILWASFLAGLVPLAARPVLLKAAQSVEQFDTAVMIGSFLSVLVLFSGPVTLLGCVSPYAIRLSITNTKNAGKISGQIYALSTMGSILGTFLPVLVLIPWLGTSRTFLVFSLSLMAMSIIGLAQINRKTALRYLWMPFVLLLLAWAILRGPIKDTAGQIFEAESAYNYIQVVEREGTRYLLLNEGQGIHSIYNPTERANYGTWDYFISAMFFNRPPIDLESVHNVGIVGMAAGTIAKQYSEIFGPIPIIGWEIDPEIIEVGREYFDMNEPNVIAIAQDGRWGLEHSDTTFSVIGVDAYRLPYIPFHLTTKEFFQQVKDHLEENGVLVINVGRTFNDRRLIDAISGTIGSVFPSIHLIDVPDTFNSILYGTVQETSFEYLVENFLALEKNQADPVLLNILERTIENFQSVPQSEIVYTDDWAPIERLTDSIALRFILGGNVDVLR